MCLHVLFVEISRMIHIKFSSLLLKMRIVSGEKRGGNKNVNIIIIVWSFVLLEFSHALVLQWKMWLLINFKSYTDNFKETIPVYAWCNLKNSAYNDKSI